MAQLEKLSHYRIVKLTKAAVLICVALTSFAEGRPHRGPTINVEGTAHLREFLAIRVGGSEKPVTFCERVLIPVKTDAGIEDAPRAFDVEYLDNPDPGVLVSYEMTCHLKKAGLVTEYRIYQSTPRNPNDANLILTVTYPNYAALDHNADFDAITTKVEGSLKQASASYGARESIREVLGSELVQELIPK